MRTVEAREVRRPRGMVLRPLVLLLAAIVTGLGMWHALMQDGGHGRFSIQRLVRGLVR